MTAPAPTEEDQGLICAFWLSPLEACDGAAALKARPEDRPAWLHFNLADARARRWLERESGLAPSVLKHLMDPEPRVHVEVTGDGLVAVLADLHHDFTQDPEGFGTIRIYLDGRRMITVRSHRLRTADRLRRELRGGAALDTPAALFAHFVESLGTTLNEALEKLTDEVDRVEDEVLAGRFHAQGSVTIRLRRSVARLRRHISANRTAVGGLKAHVPAVLHSGGEPARLRPAIERFDTLAQDLEILQERTRLLQEEISGRLAEATNRNLFVLSTITVALLPITLITGIFGMNVGGLPWVNDSHGFAWVMVGMGGALAVALFLLYRHRVL